jgi:hypothetical protein
VADGDISLLAIYDKVASVDTKVESLGADVRAQLAHGQRRMEDHEIRLRALEVAIPDRLEMRVTALERLAWKLIGAFAAVNVAAGIAEWLLTRHP